MLERRAQSEVEAAAPILRRNRLHAPTLIRLLDERKAARTQTGLKELAERYGLDVDVMERIASFVSSPSIPANALRTSLTEGERDEVRPSTRVSTTKTLLPFCALTRV